MGATLDRIGPRQESQRLQVGYARHRHKIARGRVVAKRQECQGNFGPIASGNQRRKGRISEAVEFAGRHVPGARRMVIDGKIQTVEDTQLRTILGKEIFVAHPLGDVFGDRCNAMIAYRENIPLLKESVDSIDPFGVHQVRGIPPSRCVVNDIVRPWVTFSLRVRSRRTQNSLRIDRCCKTKSSQSAAFQEIST